MRNAKNILQHELIGMDVEIISSPLQDKFNVRGTIIDETRNMLVLEQGQKEIQIPKQGTVLAFNLPADDSDPEKLMRIEVDGKLFIARPEDRVKKNEGKSRRK